MRAPNRAGVIDRPLEQRLRNPLPLVVSPDHESMLEG
jgi:hypothetical protein